MGKDMENKRYKMLSNIKYAMSNIWSWDKAFYIYFIPCIPISVLLPLAAVYFPKIIIDAVEKHQSIQTVIFIVCFYFCAVFFVNLLKNYCSSRLDMRRYNLSILYQQKIDEKHMRTDFSNTDNPEINIKYSHAMGDASSGQCAPEFIWQSLFDFCINAFGVFTYGSIIGFLSPVILLLLMISAVITYLTGKWQQVFIEKNKDSWALLDRKTEYVSGFSSKFEYAKDIRVFHMLHWLNELLDGFLKERFVWTKKISFHSLAGVFVGAFLAFIRDGAAYVLLIFMFLNGRIGVGDFVFFFGTISGFSTWLLSIAGNINDIVGKSIKIGYYREYFDMQEKFNHGSGCALPKEDELPAEIEFCRVSYRYPGSKTDTLKNISFLIKKGEKLAIVGINGAGKTTLVKLLCGFYYPTEGEIKVNRRSVTEYNIEEYYSLFSAVFQDLYLLPVTIAEFVSSNDISIDRDRVEAVIRLSGLEKKVSGLRDGIDSRLMKGVFDDSIELSGGEKQKLMLARALYKNAPVIVLDEPTASLDPIAENELYLKYNDLTKNKTAVFISHRLASTRFCDRIILIDHGEIAEIGSHKELMEQNNQYAHMFHIQSHYYKEAPDNEENQ